MDPVWSIMPITARRWVLPSGCSLIDSSPLTRFMGVRTFLSVTSNWSVMPLGGGPGPWLARAGQLSSSVWETKEPLWWIIYSHNHSLPCEDEPTVIWVISIYSVSTDVSSINCWEKTTLCGPLGGQISKYVKAGLDKAEPLSPKQTNESEWLTFRLCYSTNLSRWELNLHHDSLHTPPRYACDSTLHVSPHTQTPQVSWPYLHKSV